MEKEIKRDNDFPLREMDITIKGENYTLAESTIRDYNRLKKYLLSERIKAIQESMADAPISDRVMVISEITRRGVTDMEVIQSLTSTEGMIFIIWCGLVRNNPEIILDDVFDLFSTDPKELLEIFALQHGINLDEDDKPKKDGAEKAE